MFRQAAAGPFDDVVARATDENLTAEDWGAIMEVCDHVATDANGAKEAVQSMIKRLAHRNANVQLYTLELANALSQNCDKKLHRELASRAFTDALLRLANDRTTHAQVKSKVLERMKGWSDMFKTDPDLGIMHDGYFRLKQANPSLQPPSAPQKNSLTDVDRRKEEEELQIALTLSLQEEERKRGVAAAGAAAPSSSSAVPVAAAAAAHASAASHHEGEEAEPGGADAAAAEATPVPSGTTAATVSRVRALFDFQPAEPSELEFKKGDVIAVLESVYKDWWRGSLKGRTGIFPLNYVEKLSDPTPDELRREAQMEAEVFAEIKNVEKLLTLLSAGGSTTAVAASTGGGGGAREEDSEEIGKLYHQTLAIRPKLIKLIEKYSQKKDDFTQLNEKFIKARRDYEALLESSMTHPPQPSYHQYAVRPGPPQQQSYSATPPPQGPQQQQQQQQFPTYQTHQARHYPHHPPQQPEPQRFYTPAPQEAHQQYPQSTPSPNFQRPAQGTPAPFYFAGSEVPSHGRPPPPPSNAGSAYPPPRDVAPRASSAGGKQQPTPIDTSLPGGSGNGNSNGHYVQGQQQQQQQQGQQPPPPQQAPPPPPGQPAQSTYGAQELATSAYDSPVVQQGQGQGNNPQSAGTYSSSVYSTDEFSSSPVAGTATVAHVPAQPSYPPPQPTYPPPPPIATGEQTAQPSYGGFGPAEGRAPTPVTAVPTVFTPPPLQPGGPGYDARHNLPSQQLQPQLQQPAPLQDQQQPQQQPQQPQQPQYRPYIPPPADEAPSAPGPADYYRQSGVY